MSNKLNKLNDLLIDELRDLYSVEHQLTKALPKMAKAAHAPELKKAFTSHLEETEGHVERLEKIFSKLKLKPTGKKCKAMEGLILEGKEMIEEEGDPIVKDAGLIGAAQRVEHYEIAAYGTARSFASTLGFKEMVEMLQETLDEEGAADQKLTEIAESLNTEAVAA